LGDFPQFLKKINEKLINIENGHADLNSIIINEYEVGQGKSKLLYIATC
jgi:hypothetical protein